MDYFENAFKTELIDEYKEYLIMRNTEEYIKCLNELKNFVNKEISKTQQQKNQKIHEILCNLRQNKQQIS